MPSTRSSLVSCVLPSSTVMTPSLPTFSIACAMSLPTSRSLFAEIVPTSSMSLLPETEVESFLSSATTFSTAVSIPFFTSMGFAPAAMFLVPSRTIACARTVAVVVPSPARSLVLEATSLTITAPRFSNLSWKSNSFATVTPSLVMVGEPKDLLMTTLRPLGPSVTLTASASLFTPRRISLRASSSYRIILPAIEYNLRLLIENCEYFVFRNDQVFLIIQFDFISCILGEEHAISRFHAHLAPASIRHYFAAANGDDFALERIFLRGVGNDNASPNL